MATVAIKKDSQTGAELLVKSLESQGVEYVFGIPGAKIDKVFDTLSDSKIRTVATTSLTAPESISALNLVTGRKRLTVSIVW